MRQIYFIQVQPDSDGPSKTTRPVALGGIGIIGQAVAKEVSVETRMSTIDTFADV